MLSGGELAALVLLDACVRLLPGVMGKAESGHDESFENGLLEYPHYTRPREWEGRAIPDVLLSGDHGRIAALAAARRPSAHAEATARTWRARRARPPGAEPRLQSAHRGWGRLLDMSPSTARVWTAPPTAEQRAEALAKHWPAPVAMWLTSYTSRTYERWTSSVSSRPSRPRNSKKSAAPRIPAGRHGPRQRARHRRHRTRVQAYEGVVIARAGAGFQENFTVRKISYGEGVERVFPVYSPMVEGVEIVRRGKVRRAKLYYLRDRRGKSARIAERKDAPKGDKAAKAK